MAEKNPLSLPKKPWCAGFGGTTTASNGAGVGMSRRGSKLASSAGAGVTGDGSLARNTIGASTCTWMSLGFDAGSAAISDPGTGRGGSDTVDADALISGAVVGGQPQFIGAAVSAALSFPE